MAVLEAAPPALDPVPNVGQIALACVLGYRDLRFGGTLAQGLSAPARLARRLRRASAGLRGDKSRALTRRAQAKSPGAMSGALSSVVA